MVLGTNGEGPSFSAPQRRRMVEVGIEQAETDGGQRSEDGLLLPIGLITRIEYDNRAVHLFQEFKNSGIDGILSV